MSAHLLTCINCSLPIFVDNSIPPSSCLLLLSLLCFRCPSWHSNFTHKLHLRGSKDYSATVEDAGRHAGWSKRRPQDSMRGVGWVTDTGSRNTDRKGREVRITTVRVRGWSMAGSKSATCSQLTRGWR